MRPTGKLHLGNYMGALANWVKLQESGLYECYFFIADWHALTTDYGDPSQIRKNIADVALDYLAAGLDPERSVLFVQSHVPQHAELHLLLSMITSLSWLERVPSYKDQQENISGKDLTTYGFLGYPLLQAADILIYQPRFVPVGQDQVAHVELTREVARRFRSIYKTDILPEPDVLLTPSPKVPGTDGRKMSKSYGNTIGLTDSAKLVSEKLEKMSNGGQRSRISDPGDPEKCPVYDLHKLFSAESVLKETADGCSTATISCTECKQLAANSISRHLQPIQARRTEGELAPSYVQDVLKYGANRAATRAEQTMELVREAMGVQKTIEFPTVTFFDRYNQEIGQSTRHLLINHVEKIWDAGFEARRTFLIDYWKSKMVPSDCQLKQQGDRLFVTNRNKRVFASTAREMYGGLFKYFIPNKSYEVLVLLAWEKSQEAELKAFVIPLSLFGDRGPGLRRPARPAAGPDPQAGHRHLRHSHRQDHGQFLAYVNQLKASDVDVAGEFIYTASLLIHIKSKMLLPRAPPARTSGRGSRAASWWSGCWSTSASRTPPRCCNRSRCWRRPPGPIPAPRVQGR
jgi:tryptophanyl-tRNA synthetase